MNAARVSPGCTTLLSFVSQKPVSDPNGIASFLERNTEMFA